MDKIIKNCFVVRLCGAIARAFPGSLPGKLTAAVKRGYEKSVTAKAVTSFLSVCPKTVYSKLYAKFLSVNKFFMQIGASLHTASENSLIMRGLRAVSNSGAVNGSIILSSLKKLGMKRLLIAVFALYLPLDVLIRDVVGIEILSSLWDEALMLFCIMYIIFTVSRRSEITKPRITPLDAPLILFLAVAVLVMCVVSPNFGVAFEGFRAVCQFMLWFFVLTRLIENDDDFKTLYFTMCAMICAVALHGIYQYITCAPMPEQWVARAEAGVRTRVYSILGSPNVMGALMVMGAPMLASCAYYAKKLWVKCVMWGFVGIICLSTLFTFSRGAWFGLTIAVIIFSLLVDRKLLLFGAVGIVAIIFCVPSISNRIAFLFTSDFATANSTGGRGERWQIGLSLWRTNKLFGFGLGRYGGAIAMQNQHIDDLVYYYMDNYYLKTLTEMGLLGLISYVWLLLRNLVWSVRSVFRSRKSKISVLVSGIISGCSGVLAHSFFENIFEVPYMNAYFWGLAAAVMYVGFIRRRHRDSQSKTA